VTYLQGGTMGASRTLSCQTTYKPGVLGQYGASGYYIDGCTVKLDCPANTGLYPVKQCDVSSYTYIDTNTYRGDRVTMNARIRRFDRYGSVYGWSDKSCSDSNRCTTEDSSVIYPGQSASVQCNGVREARPYDGNTAKDYCNVKLSYRATDPPAQTPIGTQVGSGECTDWALDRRPDLRAIVSGNAQNWTAQARNAGRPVSKTPTAGSVMVLQGGVQGAFIGTGHVAYVESVNATSFVVSEQNWNGIRYSTTRTIQISSLPATGVDFIG
jgi:surface antigen